MISLLNDFVVFRFAVIHSIFCSFVGIFIDIRLSILEMYTLSTVQVVTITVQVVVMIGEVNGNEPESVQFELI
jgi:hypothetical protein